MVDAVDGETITVSFAEYGNVEKVPVNDVYPLPQSEEVCICPVREHVPLSLSLEVAYFAALRKLCALDGYRNLLRANLTCYRNCTCRGMRLGH